MKHTTKILTATVLVGILFGGNVFAGNQDRVGQAGASELLINPWARGSGWGDANIAGCRGLESTFLNVAGTAFTQKTELLFDHTDYLSGSGVGINAIGFTQKAGASGVLGLNIMSMNFGNIPVTTTNMPEGGLGNFNINMINIGLSYAKAFTDHIFGGMNFKVVDEAIPNARAAGVALDGGIQYVSGPMNNIHFGISLKNIGPQMQFSGDGLAFKAIMNPGLTPQNNLTVQQRSAPYEMPTQLNIGGSYDWYFGDTVSKAHRITVALAFASNAFGKDQTRLGLEYGFKSFIMLRAGYCYEQGITNNDDTKSIYRTTAFTGVCAGFTIVLPLNKEKHSTFDLDYSYRASNPFGGSHCIGVRINL